MGRTLEEARIVKDKAKELFTSNVGVGITRIADGYAVKVNLRHPIPDNESVPTSIDGVPIRFEIVGELHKQ
jgi:hypothetical protein